MFKKLVPFIGMAAIIFAVIVCGLYFYIFTGEFSSNQSDWGSFGSYLGGTIGALFASLSFLALLYTVYLQREELSIAINKKIGVKSLLDSTRTPKRTGTSS